MLFRSGLAKKSASAMVFVEVASATASSLGAATPVPSPRSAGRLSWKSRISSERRGVVTGVDDLRVFFFFSSFSYWMSPINTLFASRFVNLIFVFSLFP